MIGSIRGSIKRSPIVKDLLSVTSVQCSTGPYTLRCHTNLIEDLLHEQYQFVLTERLQSDRVERRLGQYPQTSDGRFSISAKVYARENIENHEPRERMIWHQLIRQNSQHSGVKFYFIHISQNKLFFLLIDVFFDADSKSEIRIFWTALVFEL